MPGPHSSLMVLPGRAGQRRKENGGQRTNNATDTRSESTCNFKANTVARAAPRRVRLSGADPSVSRVHAGKVSSTTCRDLGHDRINRAVISRRDGRRTNTERKKENGHAMEGHPWASASSYSSLSLADSRCNLHATSHEHTGDRRKGRGFTTQDSLESSRSRNASFICKCRRHGRSVGRH